MRNLRQYPLTSREAHDVLQQKINEFANKRTVGGIEGHALIQINEFLKKNSKEFEAFLSGQLS